MKPDLYRHFSQDEVRVLKREGLKAEKAGRWTPEMFRLAEEKRLIHLMVPEQYGGRQLPLPEYLPWLECASWLDGSFGWNMTLASGAGIFAAYMNPSFANKIFSNEKLFISGSGYPGGTAEKNKAGSFSVNGKWKYASGLKNADLITANCFIKENGKSLIKDGKAVIKAVACYPDEVEITGEWNSYGLKGTNTLNFEINDKTIPQNRVFEINADSTKVSGALYQYPFDPFARCTLATAFLGMSERFMYEAKHILLEKNNLNSISSLPEKLRNSMKKSVYHIRSARENLFNTVSGSWNSIETNKNSDNEFTDDVAKTAIESTGEILKSVQAIYPYLGMKAVNPKSDINRFWRDLHTASQHMLLTPVQK